MPMKDDTLLTHAGLAPGDNHGIVNPPVYHASTVLFPSLDAFEGLTPVKITYGRQGTPTAFALEEALTALEGGAGTVLTPSGLNAASTALLACTEAGQHVLVSDSVYGPTRNFCDRVLSRYGIVTEYYDPLIGGAITGLLHSNTAVVFLESPGSQTFEVQDVASIANAAHAAGTMVVVDNTWGAGYYFKALRHGADIAVHAGTKYAAGHSDVMMGAIICNERSLDQVSRFAAVVGNSVGPDDAYLTLRGLRTMGVRLQRHQVSALSIARWLAQRPEIMRVIYPALPDDPGHELWRRDFTGACGLFGFVLRPCSRGALGAMLDGMRYFGMGYSWGGYESLLIPTYPERNRTVTPWVPDGQTMRIHVGLEDSEDLIADLAAGLERLNAAG
jgi:cystathionine beta-lyase